jgi:hypothetical protein
MHKISILKVNSPYSGRQCMNIIIESCILHSVCTKQSQIDLVQFVRVLKSAWLLICLFTCDRRVTRHQLRRLFFSTSVCGLDERTQRRVDGVTVIPWRLGHPLAWDATVCDSTAPTYRSLAASGAELVAKQAEDRKTRIY